MQITIYAHKSCPVTQEIAAAIEDVIVLDAFAPENRAAVIATGLTATPTIIVQRDDGSDFARLERESATLDVVLTSVNAVGPILSYPPSVFVADALFTLNARHPDATFVGVLPVLVDGAAVDEAAFSAGEAAIDFLLDQEGDHTIAIGDGPAITVSVAPAPVEPEPPAE